MLIAKSIEQSKFYEKVSGLEIGKPYSFKFSLKLELNTGTKTVGFAGISMTELNDNYDNIVLPKSYAFYSLGGGSFAYDKDTQKGKLAYNGEDDWIDYEVRFIAEQSNIFFYFESNENVQDMLLDNIRVSEADSIGKLNLNIKAATKSTVNVLLIGNSYAFDATRELMGDHGYDGIINCGEADLRFGCLYTGGQPFSYFKDQIFMDANSMNFRYYAKGDEAVQKANGVSLSNAVEILSDNGQKWDYIFIQAATNTEWAMFSEKNSAKTDELNEYIQLLRTKSANSDIAIYCTWAATDLFNNEKSDYTKFKTQDAQHKAIAEAVENIKLETGCRVLNMEQIFHSIRTNDRLEIGDGLNRDGYHLNGIGAATVGLAVYEFFTEKNVENNKWDKLMFGAYGVKGAETSLTEEKLSQIKHIVHSWFCE